jgi:hypothetical protein
MTRLLISHLKLSWWFALPLLLIILVSLKSLSLFLSLSRVLFSIFNSFFMTSYRLLVSCSLTPCLVFTLLISLTRHAKLSFSACRLGGEIDTSTEEKERELYVAFGLYSLFFLNLRFVFVCFLTWIKLVICYLLLSLLVEGAQRYACPWSAPCFSSCWWIVDTKGWLSFCLSLSTLLVSPLLV